MRTALLLALVAAPLPVLAQQAAKPASQADASGDEAGEDAEIVVTGQRPPGSVPGDIPPERSLTPADIRSYGVSSISELLDELAPQTRSGRGAGGMPVVLLNGRRISGFAEIRDLPTEAILRVDILPEEVALKYGYRADQRVVNFVLRRRFRAAVGEGNVRLPTEGGRSAAQTTADLLNIRRDTRATLHLEYNRASALTEAERDIVPPAAGTASLAGNVVAGSAVTGIPAAAATGRASLADFLATPATATDPTPYRTLLPATESFAANAVFARPIGRVSTSLNARIEATESDRLNGLPAATLAVPQGNPYSPFAGDVTVARLADVLPLAQRASGLNAHVGATANGDSGRWRWSLTGNYDRAQSDTYTETGVDLTAFQARVRAGDPTANPFGALPYGAAPSNLAFSTSSAAGLDALVAGPVLTLPAGAVNTSIRIGAQTTDFSSRSLRAGIASSGDVSRDIANAQMNVDVPIAGRGTLDWLGNFSLNGNVAVDRLSDFGTLWTLGYGANWAPVDGLRVIASHTDQDEAPTAQQLGNPLVLTPAVRVYDYVRGETATVTTVSGGNTALVADSRHATKVGAQWKPFRAQDLVFSVDYTRQATDDPIAAFPAPTAAIEAAFPGRFTRDANGMLLRLDARPINFARSERSEIRWGINASKALKSKLQRQIEAWRAGTGPNPFAGLRPPAGFRRDNAGDGAPPPPAAGDAPPPPPPGGEPPRGDGGGGGPRGFGGPGGGGRGGGFGGGRFGGGGAGQAGGRLQFALYHTLHLTDSVTVADGGPVLDLLRGDAIGNAGGQSRHELEGQAGYVNNGLGARLSVNWQSGTRVIGGTPTTPETLRFSSLGTANLRLFADLGQRLDWVKAHPWMRGMRVALSIDNLANERQRVTDATGTTPIGYQPGYLDPLGRSVRLSVRKLFF